MDIPPAPPSASASAHALGHAHAHAHAHALGQGPAAPTPSTAYTQPPYTQPPHTQPTVHRTYTQPTPDSRGRAQSGRTVWPSPLRAPCAASGFVTPHDARAAPGARLG